MSSCAAKAVAQGTPADAHRLLRLKTRHHLDQRDVRAHLDHPYDEVRVFIKARAAPAPLLSRCQLADLRQGDPTDRARYSDAEKRRRLTRRCPFVCSLQNTQPQILAERSRHHQPPSKQTLNQKPDTASHHNRFIVARTCSRSQPRSGKVHGATGQRQGASQTPAWL